MGTSLPGEIDASQILDERLYSQLRQGGARDHSVGRIVLLLSQSRCDSCQEALLTWARVLTLTTPGSVDYWLVTFDDVGNASALLAALDSSSHAFRVLRIADPVTYRTRTGIEQVPLAIAVEQGRVSCIFSGVTAESAIRHCLLDVQSQTPPLITRDPRVQFVTR